jgi:hypothetical protein
VPEVENPARSTESDKAVNKMEPLQDRSEIETISPPFAQEGVKYVEGTTKVWSKSHLIAVYVLIWIICFINSMQGGTSNLSSLYHHKLFFGDYKCRVEPC